MPNYLSRMKPNGANGTEYKLKDEELREAFDVFKEDIKGTQTATGNPITLTDGSETYTQSLVVELEPKQNLHGQSAPYVGGAGKNKLPLIISDIKAANTNGTWSGNTYTVSGVTFTVLTDNDGNVVGIQSNNGGTASIALPFTLKAGTYIMSSGFTETAGTNDTVLLLNNTAIARGNDYTPGQQFTLSSDSSVRWAFRVATVSILCKPMIRLSTETDQTFAPYSNISPISGYEGVEVGDVGINQWDEETKQGYYNASTGAYVNVSGQLCTNDFIPVNPSTTYYCKKGSATNSGQILFYDAEKHYLSYLAIDSFANKTFQTPANCYYMTFNLGDAYGTTYNNDISINYPSTDHDYHPYQSRTATISFSQTLYGGECDFVEGGTEKTKIKDILPNSWNVNTTDNDYWVLSQGVSGLKQITNADKTVRIISDKLQGMSANECIASRVPYSIAVISGSRLFMVLKKSDFATLSDVNTWVGAQNIEICYEVETPTTLSTPPTDLKLLQGTNNLTTNGTTITLDYIPNNSIGDAVKASEEYTDRAVEGKADNTTAYVDLPGNYDTTNKNFPTRSATSGSVENCLTYINDLADKLYTAINSHATALANIPTKTVVVNHRAIDVGDEFNISLPLSYKFLIIELTIILTDEVCYGSIVSTDFANGSVLSIVANGHGLSYWCDLSRMANTITVDGNFDSAHGELTITAF